MAEDRREKHLAGFLKSMPLTDGSCQGTLGEWLERAELVVEFVPGMDIVTFKRFLVKTATGSLLQDICNYHDDVNREKLLVVDPDLDWGDVNPRVTRRRRPPHLPVCTPRPLPVLDPVGRAAPVVQPLPPASPAPGTSCVPMDTDTFHTGKRRRSGGAIDQPTATGERCVSSKRLCLSPHSSQ